MHRFTEFRPTFSDQDGPSLLEVLENYYMRSNDCINAHEIAMQYIEQWCALERENIGWAHRLAQMDEIQLADESECALKALLKQLDILADYWSDNGKLRRCHERLQGLIKSSEFPTP